MTTKEKWFGLTEKGKKEGKEESAKVITLNMLKLEIDLDTISKATGLKKVPLIN